MKNAHRLVCAAALLLAATAFLPGCEKEPETPGEKLDKAVEGAVEDAGDALDDAAKDAKKAMDDAKKDD